MASKDSYVSEQGTAHRMKHLTVTVQLEIIGALKIMEAKEKLWLHTTLDCQLSVIQRNGMANYDCLWHHVSVKDF
jgi:hypothetical protein